MLKQALKILAKSLKFIRKSTLIIIILVLLGVNVLTLASGVVYGALYGLLSSLPMYSLLDNSMSNKNKKLNRKLTAKTNKNKKLKQNLSTKTKSYANLASKNQRLKYDLDAKTKSHNKLVNKNHKIKRQLRIRTRKYDKLATKNQIIKNKIPKITKRAQSRVIKSIVTNIAAIPAEAVPFVGIAAIIASTGYELYESCQIMKDLHKINTIIDPDAVDKTYKVCGIKTPSAKY